MSHYFSADLDAAGPERFPGRKHFSGKMLLWISFPGLWILPAPASN
jgi:hypothetical protein